MPFPDSVCEEALVRSRRCCCVCRVFCRVNIEVHHIDPESNGGPNTLDNAIPLCFNCHADVGHYNLRYPRGKKYSPSELHRHRDEWWRICNSDAVAMASLRDSGQVLPPACAEFEMIEREVGTLWSGWANEPKRKELIRFRGAKLGGYTQPQPYFNHDEWELFLVRGGRYLVYHKHVHRGDWCKASLLGKWGEMDCPLTLEEVQSEYPELATSVGMERVRVLDV